MVDSSTELDENDKEIISVIKDKKVIILLNKSDLDQITTEDRLRKEIGSGYPIISISAKENAGMDLLEQKIKEMFYHGEISFNDEIYITNARQKSSLMDTAESLKKVLESIELGLPEDFYSIDLMSAYESLGNIIGESVGEDLINEIFGRFCMGK